MVLSTTVILKELLLLSTNQMEILPLFMVMLQWVLPLPLTVLIHVTFIGLIMKVMKFTMLNLIKVIPLLNKLMKLILGESIT